MQIREYIRQTEARFDAAGLSYGHGTDNALDEAVYLVYGLLHIDFDCDVESQQRELSVEELQVLDEAVAARVEQHRPVAYLVGEAWFAGLRFICDERALVPRSPIAELIVNRFEPLVSEEPRRILDLCCGSGCIGIACAHYFTEAEVDLADISADCLALAQQNVALHDLERRVNLIQSDLFSNIEGKYDLIVTNPPYVSQREFDSLPPEFQYEPASGLVSAERGLAIPLAILRQAAAHLRDGGVLIMEVGFSANALSERLARVPLLWLEFEHGGEGVLALTRAQLLQYSDSFN